MLTSFTLFRLPRLPRLPHLPHFLLLLYLTKFIYQFEEIVNKYSYSEYEKLILLKQQVSARALILTDSLETQNQMMQGAIDAEAERQGALGKNKSEPNLDNKKNGGKTEAPDIDIKKAKI